MNILFFWSYSIDFDVFFFLIFVRFSKWRLPALPNSTNSEARVLEIQVPASALQENKLHTALTATPIIQSIMTLPSNVAASVLQQHINAVLANSGTPIARQVDGTADTSDEDGSDVSDDNLDNDDDDDNMQVNIFLLQVFDESMNKKTNE